MDNLSEVLGILVFSIIARAFHFCRRDDEFDATKTSRSTARGNVSAASLHALTPEVQAMLATLKHPDTFNSSHAADDDEQPGHVDWNKLRKAIRKRLRHHFRVTHLNWSDFDDSVQDAAGFAFQSIQRGTPAGLAIFRAVGRVKRGQTFTWEPVNRSERPWEERIDLQRSLNGVGQATRRAASGLPLSGRSILAD